MKKILLLLIFCYSFAFSTTNSSSPDSYYDIARSRNYILTNTTQYSATSLYGYVGTASVRWAYVDDGSFILISKYYTPYSSGTNYTRYRYKTEYIYGNACTYGTVPNEDLTQCVVPPPVCDPDTEELINGECYDKCPPFNALRTGDMQCHDCNDFLSLKSIANCMCMALGQTFTGNVNIATVEIIGGYKFLTRKVYCDGGSPSNGGTVVYPYLSLEKPDIEYDTDPCITAVSPNYSSSYIFKGYVDKELECKKYIDGVNYLNYSVQRVFPKCPTKKELYCFLLPALDNNDTGFNSNFDKNNTLPNGNIINPNLPPIDNNSTPNVSNPSDSVGKSNALIGQLTGDFRAYFEWQKTKNGTYAKALTKFGRDFLKGQDKTKMNNDNSNTNSIVNAINGVGTADMSGVEDKLDTLIGSDTSDQSGEVLGSMGVLTDMLGDVNTSMPILNDDNNNTTYSDIVDLCMVAFDGFENKSISALSTLVDSIDYGISDMFDVPNYDFVNYPISVTLPMTTIKLEGNLMSADFLNSLDFSLGRLALLLSTLILSVYYVINKLFP